jgi:hypothetical protein
MKFGSMYKGTIGLSILLLLTVSCTEIIDIELDSTYQRLVVYGTVTEDSIYHHIRLSLSSDYFSNAPSPRISNALVELECEGKTIPFYENDTIPGLYLSAEAFRGVPEKQYSLYISQVDVDGDGEGEEYQAKSRMPLGARLDSITVSYFQSPFVSGYQVFMYALDPPQRNWYSFKIWKNQELLTDTLSKYAIQSDDFFNGTYIYGLPVGFLIDDDPREAAKPGDTITFELNAIDQSYFDFLADAQLEIAGNNPLFSGPPANIRTNIENGAQGVFAAYSIQRISVVIPEESR